MCFSWSRRREGSPLLPTSCHSWAVCSNAQPRNSEERQSIKGGQFRGPGRGGALVVHQDPRHRLSRPRPVHRPVVLAIPALEAPGVFTSCCRTSVWSKHPPRPPSPRYRRLLGRPLVVELHWASVISTAESTLSYLQEMAQAKVMVLVLQNPEGWSCDIVVTRTATALGGTEYIYFNFNPLHASRGSSKIIITTTIVLHARMPTRVKLLTG